MPTLAVLAVRGPWLLASGHLPASATPAIIGTMPCRVCGRCHTPLAPCCSRPTERPVGPPA
eukprot:15435254-Alexandrium_andersonii.AAC.1